MTSDDFEREVARARTAYDDYEHEGLYDTAWSPFDEREAAYRGRQVIAMASLMRTAGVSNLAQKRVLEVGCGTGRHLRGCLDLGARPDNLVGIDVHASSLDQAATLSPHLRFEAFNGWEIPFPDGSFDVVIQFVVFSSIGLDDLRRRLASEMVRVLAPGGLLFWWDTLRVSKRASPQGEPLNVPSLFPGLPRRELRVGPHPTLEECFPVPRFVRSALLALDRLPLVPHRSTHLAALMGPKVDVGKR